MELTAGEVYDGTVTGITGFGAFVSIGGKVGLVHISEIAAGFVSDVHEFLTSGQQVRVKIIGVDKSGRINLSIKQALDISASKVDTKVNTVRTNAERRRMNPEEMTLDDKIKLFIQESESKMCDLNRHMEKRGGYRKRK